MSYLGHLLTVYHVKIRMLTGYSFIQRSGSSSKLIQSLAIAGPGSLFPCWLLVKSNLSILRPYLPQVPVM